MKICAVSRGEFERHRVQVLMNAGQAGSVDEIEWQLEGEEISEESGRLALSVVDFSQNLTRFKRCRPTRDPEMCSSKPYPVGRNYSLKIRKPFT